MHLVTAAFRNDRIVMLQPKLVPLARFRDCVLFCLKQHLFFLTGKAHCQNRNKQFASELMQIEQ